MSQRRRFGKVALGDEPRTMRTKNRVKQRDKLDLPSLPLESIWAWRMEMPGTTMAGSVRERSRGGGTRRGLGDGGETEAAAAAALQQTVDALEPMRERVLMIGISICHQ